MELFLLVSLPRTELEPGGTCRTQAIKQAMKRHRLTVDIHTLFTPTMDCIKEISELNIDFAYIRFEPKCIVLCFENKLQWVL